MTFRKHPIIERTTAMGTTARLIRPALIAGALLAVSAPAAQAMPSALSSTQSGTATTAGQVAKGSVGSSAQASAIASRFMAMHKGFLAYHTGTVSQPSQPVASNVMAAAVDSPTDQPIPTVITQPVADNVGTNWTAGLIGAGIATAVLLLAALTASLIRRPRPMAHL
jgi:hypothetical protein